MMFSSPGSVALNLGPFAIHWYGLMIGFGILLAYLYLLKESHRRELDPRVFDNMAIILIIAGVIGARLYYVLFNVAYYLKYPLEVVQVWHGGLAIHGALIGGLMVFLWYTKRHNINRLLYLDIILPGVLIAQAAGRWGNFFNNEAFGTPTNLPWKLFIPERFRPPAFATSEYFHPAFLYEFVWNIVGFLLLAFLSSLIYPSTTVNPDAPKRPYGIISCAYLMWYSFGRFFIEIVRIDSLYLGPLKAAQVASILLFCIGLFGLFFLTSGGKVKI